METPLTPLDFARRARKVHSGREAVVDGDLRLSYGAFWTAIGSMVFCAAGAWRRTGRPCCADRPEHPRDARAVLRGATTRRDRGALNYRLTVEDFVYLIEHSGSKVVCVHADYLVRSTAYAHACPGASFRRAGGRASRLGRLRVDAVRCVGSFDRPDIADRTSSLSTIRAARPRGPRAS